MDDDLDFLADLYIVRIECRKNNGQYHFTAYDHKGNAYKSRIDIEFLFAYLVEHPILRNEFLHYSIEYHDERNLILTEDNVNLAAIDYVEGGSKKFRDSVLVFIK